jgi:integrase
LVEQFPDLPGIWSSVPHHEPEAYTVEEISRMVLEARRRIGHIGSVPAAWLWPTLLMSAYYTGERIGSHLEVRWGQVDTDRQCITFLPEHRKGLGRTITRAITEQLCQWLDKGVVALTTLCGPGSSTGPCTAFPATAVHLRNGRRQSQRIPQHQEGGRQLRPRGGGNATDFLTHRQQDDQDPT